MSYGTCNGCKSINSCPMATRYLMGRKRFNKACESWEAVQEPIPAREPFKVRISANERREIVLSQKR